MLYFDILKNRRVEMSRNLTRDKETFARILIFLSIAFWAAYLLFLGAMLPSLFRAEWPGMEPYHMLNKGLALILFVDFIIRFTFPTPTQDTSLPPAPYFAPKDDGLLSAPQNLSAFQSVLDVFLHPLCIAYHNPVLRIFRSNGIFIRHLDADGNEQLLEYADMRA